MLALWSDLRLRNKLLIAMLVAGLLPLGITTYLLTERSGAALQQAAFAQLESMREVKKSQVERYFGQLHQQVRELAESTMTSDAFQQLRDGFVALPTDLPSDAAHMKAKALRPNSNFVSARIIPRVAAYSEANKYN